MKILVKVYNKSKYEADAEKIHEYILDHLKSFEVVQGEEKANIKIPKQFEDPLHEYLILHFENCEGYESCETVYCNSMVDIFKY